MAFALADIGHPVTVETLIDYVMEEKSKVSVVAALSSDPRFAKVSPTKWALVSWDLPKYSGIAISVSEILQHQGRPMPVDEAVSHVAETFGVPANSVRTCCQAPMFIIESGLIRMRTAGATLYILRGHAKVIDRYIRPTGPSGCNIARSRRPTPSGKRSGCRRSSRRTTWLESRRTDGFSYERLRLGNSNVSSHLGFWAFSWFGPINC